MAKWLLRLACFQHVKRKFLDCGDDFDAKVIVRLINFLYHKNHKHKIGEDGWTERDNYKWRQQYAIPVMHITLSVKRSFSSFSVSFACARSK